MNTHRTHKRNLIVSYKNLSEELLALLMERYPEGYKDYIQRFDKPNGDTIFVVPLETDDTVYMVKFDVKIDTSYTDDDSEKDYFDEEVDKAEVQLAPIEEAIDKEENTTTHTEREVRHGNYDEAMDDLKKQKIRAHSLGELGEELEEAFRDDEEDYDRYDDDPEEDNDEEDDYEPTDEELMDIDSEIFANAEIPPEELERMAAEEASGKKTEKNEKKEKKAPAATVKRGRPKKS